VWCRGSWDSQVPAGVRRFSGGGRCVVCFRAQNEFALSFDNGGQGYTISFEDGQVLIPKGSDLDSARVLGVREGKVYRLQGKPVSGSKGILDHGSMSVAEDEEQEAPKGTQCSETSSVGSQPSGGKEELAPSSSVRKPSWYELTLMDAQEQVEAPRSTLRESKPSTKFPNFMALICYVIEEATVQQEQQDALVQDDVCDIVLGSEGEPVPGGSSRSTFLTKREC
jgi:hypothetical protein